LFVRRKKLTLLVMSVVSLALTSLFLFPVLCFASLRYEPLQSGEPSLSSFDFFLNDAKGHWHEYAVAEMYAKGVIKGYHDNTFKPNRPVTLLEAVVMLEKLLWREPAKEDIDAYSYLEMNFGIPRWAVGYIGFALRHELLLYNELSKVSLQQPLVRQDAAVLAVRALDLAKQAKKTSETALPFTDSSQIDEGNKGYVSLACERKVMTGFPDGSFRPTDPISRGETAVLLSKIAQQIPFVNSGEVSGFVKSVYQWKNSIVLANDNKQETEISLPAKTLIYLNNKPAAVGQLSAGIHVRVINAGTDKITVLIAQNIVPDSGTEVVMEPVNLTSAPAEIRQWIETNKINENYLAGVFNGSLYFLATRGEKKTGGYTVDIFKVSRTSDEKGINFKIWIERSDPGEILTPAFEYPYAIVRVDLPQEKINSVIFVDKLNQVITEAKPPA